MAENGQTARHSSFEHLKIFLPALSLVAYIITQVTEKHPIASKVLLGLTIFFVVVGYFPFLKSKTARWAERRRDDALAKNTFPKFREFVHRFEEFIDGRMNNTLHAIVLNEILQRRAERPASLLLPNRELWHGWWLYFAQRVDRQRQIMGELRPALMEFHLLVSTYNNDCVHPIFGTLPPNVRAEIPLEAKSSLNSFQQRFERFVDEYQQFSKLLSGSRPVLHGLPCWIGAPKPLE